MNQKFNLKKRLRVGTISFSYLLVTRLIEVKSTQWNIQNIEMTVNEWDAARTRMVINFSYIGLKYSTSVLEN